MFSDDEGSSEFDKEKQHALLVILGWGVLVPIGILAARYFKSYDPHWFYGHISIQTIGFGLGLAGIIMGFDLDEDEIDNYDTHKALGIVVLVLGCLQVSKLFSLHLLRLYILQECLYTICDSFLSLFYEALKSLLLVSINFHVMHYPMIRKF